MKALFRRITALTFGPTLFPLFLTALCVAAYTPLITRLGFYWDDFPISWIASSMGGDGLARYFSTNRPVWGLVYRTTTPLLGSDPLTWQFFALMMRIVTGLSFWSLLRLTWPKRETFAAWAAALFVLYPGFSQQFIAFLYSHFYIILTAYLLSLVLMVQALRRPRFFWPLTGASVLLSLLNLFAMEYFFLLDLLRPLLIGIVLSQNAETSVGERLKRALLTWLPYLVVFAGAIYWRSVLFGFQTYQPTLMTALKTNPIQALQTLIPIVLRDVWMTGGEAWLKAFVVPTITMVGERNLQRFWLMVAIGIALALVFLMFYRPTEKGKQPAPSTSKDRWWAWQPVALGLVALLIAGGPFWLTSLEIGLVFPNDRFTLPFMIGASLVLAGLMQLLPFHRWTGTLLIAVLLGFSVGTQFHYAVSYTRDWSVQRNMFSQMLWRMPDLQPGTTLLMNELPVTHYTDNSLTAPLNWIYDPNNDPLVMQYAIFYPTLRKQGVLSNLEPDKTITLDYLAARFTGSTNQMVTLIFTPPSCLRVLDPEVESENWLVPDYLRETLSVSTTSPILARPVEEKGELRLPGQVYGPEIPRGWCYYFEQADLARQLGDWQSVVELGDEGFSASDYPNDPIERFPFIEGYAHTGNWERAIELTRDAYAITPVMGPPLCKLWQRIARETTADAGQQQALQTIREAVDCTHKKQ